MKTKLIDLELWADVVRASVRGHYHAPPPSLSHVRRLDTLCHRVQDAMLWERRHRGELDA